MAQPLWVSESSFTLRVPRNQWPPIACWAWENGITPSGVLSRTWSVGGGRCPPLRGCWSVQSLGRALWSAWSARPGIGKSRLVREVSAMADAGDIDVFTAFCESHTSQVPFHAVARLLRAATSVEGLDEQTARDRVRDGIPEADPEDVLLFDDMLGIADPDAPLPAIDPDARRRRLTALVNASSLARKTPAVYVVEDAHWIDEVSKS